jgi:endonuclease YncB( thermonuclease family)
MIRLTPWRGPEPRERRGFGWGDAIRAAVVLCALVAIALYVIERRGSTISGFATVTDGDSLRIDGVAIRIEGIDTPELQQNCEAKGQSYHCGEAARRELARLIDGAAVTCEVVGQDRYRRSLARCEAGGGDLGAALVRRGFAVAYGKTYAREEAQARRERAGLWAGQFQTPAEWRKEHRPPP